MDMTAAVYLDHNATTPIRPAALDALVQTARAVGNPSSVHGAGRAARGRLETARSQVAALVGRPAAQVVFTSGGTEADALAVRGSNRQRCLVSAIEHDAVLAAADGAQRITVGAEGRVDLADLEQRLAAGDAPALVSVMWVNNETGVIQPIAEVVRLAHAAGALVHVDAVQGAGKLDPSSLAGADLIALSAHKIGGPAGVGALVVRPEVVVRALAVGGGQERGFRSGTENLPGIAGFGAAAEAIGATGGDEMRHARVLRDRLEAEVLALAPEARVFGQAADRVATTTCLGLPGVPAETQVMTLDLAGIAVSAGSACSSGKVKRSHVLAAMLGDDPITGQAIRISLGWTTTAADVDRFVAAWSAMRDRLSPTARSL
ncbi:Cysteine sulfinate desulfinase/cysteine desulfurase and related enzyme [alpha proteobacterium BAL199]|jgi:cysteine desulfurase|nr:Cysteine sulfinate desulfinase/cysteine desulfurase and related enzyme [alpha proteobacterium BAL199]